MLKNHTVQAIALMWSALFIVSSCARTPELAVKVSRDPGANFQSYQTFAWQSGQRKFTERGEQRLRGTVDQELIAKGYRKAASEKDADLLIKYLGIQERQQIQKALVTGPGSAMLIPETVDTGALRLQFVDRKNNRVVWQGDASAVVRDPRNVTEVTPAVKAILAKFPKR